MKPSDFQFFWGHTGPAEKACFSQWYMRGFTVGGRAYCCMEQYMMAEKARLFGDAEALEKILDSNEQVKIKKYGREVKNFVSEVWDEHKFGIVYTGNLAKFSQNEDLKAILLATGDKILVEASPYDKIWGIGMDVNNPDIIHPEKWRGQNLLGKALMEVRKTLKA